MNNNKDCRVGQLTTTTQAIAQYTVHCTVYIHTFAQDSEPPRGQALMIMTMILWRWQIHLSHFISYYIQLCTDLTHRVSSGYTWRSYCTLPGSRSRTWREKSYNFLPCWPEVGETRVMRSGVGIGTLARLGFGVKAFCHQTWSSWPRLPLGARLSHLCRCRAPEGKLENMSTT